MKKIVLLAVFAIALTMTGCNGCTMMAKNIESNYSELHRDVVVLNAFTGDTLFAYSGPCYFNTHEHSNDVSIIYSVNGRKLKADFVGAGFVFKAVEK